MASPLPGRLREATTDRGAASDRAVVRRRSADRGRMRASELVDQPACLRRIPRHKRAPAVPC